MVTPVGDGAGGTVTFSTVEALRPVLSVTVTVTW